MNPLRLLPCLGMALMLCNVAPAQTPQARVVVSGFEPFGGRTLNASWVLAGEIKKQNPGVKLVQVPVVWGAPLKAIRSVKPAPEVWIAFGEGTREFQIELLGHNKRGQHPDNNGAQPAAPDIVADAPAVLENGISADALASALTSKGFPTLVSRNAGSYLCEEMLYSLLYAKQQSAGIMKVVMFVHVPTLESEIGRAGGQKVDPAYLAGFGRQLFVELAKLGLTGG